MTTPVDQKNPANDKAAAENQNTQAEQQKPKNNGKKRSKTLWIFTFILLVIAITWWCLWYFYWSYYEYTDDAYASGHQIIVNSAISGTVIAFYAENTSMVKEGQILVDLDRTSYQIKFDKALASLADTVLQVRQIYDNVKTAQIQVENKKTSLQRIKYDYENRAHLVQSKAVSNEDYIHSQNSTTIAELDLRQAQYQLQIALDARGQTELEDHPRIESAKADVRQAYYELYHCTIYAPASGIVAQRSVDVGKSVTPTIALMSIIPQNFLWVDANFKETQLANMRIGQRADVWFDIYGSKLKFEGFVSGISAGSGSAFSLIPPQNATGNWIKIVQRLPVRIDLSISNLQKIPARLGISAEVSVDITNQELPLLAPFISENPISTTDIYTFSYQVIDELMEQIIQNNLK